MNANERIAAHLAPILIVERSASPVSIGALFRDLQESAKTNGFWFYSSWIEILLAYRSTALGPLWILIGTGVFVFFVGSLYGRVGLTGGTNVYLAHLAVGIILWFFISSTLVGGCRLYWSNRSNILDGANSYTDLILKSLTTNLIYLLHNAVIIVLVFLFTSAHVPLTAFALLLTVPLLVANVLWMTIILSILGARYGDLDEIMHSTLRLLFFITPILWIPHEHVRGPMVDAVLYLNPFYYLLEIVREPLVYGQIPYLEIGVSLAVLPFGWLAACLLYSRTRSWIALWL